MAFVEEFVVGQTKMSFLFIQTPASFPVLKNDNFVLFITLFIYSGRDFDSIMISISSAPDSATGKLHGGLLA